VLDTAERSLIPRLLGVPVPTPAAVALERITGIRRIMSLYSGLREMDGALPISDRLLRRLRVEYRISEADLEHIPRRGPAVVALNHPFGILEGAIAASILGGIRSDVKFLANGILSAIPEVRDMIIAVDPMGGGGALRSNPGGLRQAIRFLGDGGLLVVFPAGEVSHFQWRERRVADPPWDPSIARMVEIAARRAESLSVIPAFVEGANSALFHALGLLHPRLRTAMLARELLNKRGARVEIRVGGAIAAKKLLALPTDEERVRYLRWRTYLLAARQDYRARTAWPLRRRRTGDFRPFAPAESGDVMTREVEMLAPSSLLVRSGELSAYIATSAEIPAVLREIGRLREITFRAAGEGTGSSADLDEFDERYQHLFVWNESKREVVGAYRLARTDEATSDLGPRGLYTATLFDYGAEFLRRLGPAIELGRSFVRAEYQKGFTPLLLLWKGIGAWVARQPRYKVLFGPVSISNRYQSISRELMVAYLERHASLRDWAGLVATRNPFRPSGRAKNGMPASGFDIQDLSAVVADVEPSRAGVPVLLRQYLKLGGKLLGFNVDPRFSNALDGLILVDLTKTEPRLLARYLGVAEAEAFLAYQRGIHGTQ
jgi:putative hemolysin